MNELQNARTLDVIGAEIRSLSTDMQYHMRATIWTAVEIGRRLAEARDKVKHGEWGPFLKEYTTFSSSQAANLINVFNAYGNQQKSLFGTEVENSQTFGNLTFSKALALLAVPEEDREQFVKDNDVEAMSTRQLQKVIKERDEAKKALDTALANTAKAENYAAALVHERDESRKVMDSAIEDAKKAEQEADALRAQVKELESRPVEVAVQVDEEAIKKAVEEAQAAADARLKKEMDKAAKKLKAAEKARDEALELAKEAEEKAGPSAQESDSDLEKLKAEAEQARGEVERLRKQLNMSGEKMARFKTAFKVWQTEHKNMEQARTNLKYASEGFEIASQGLDEALAGLDPETAEKAEAAVKAQQDSWAAG